MLSCFKIYRLACNFHTPLVYHDAFSSRYSRVSLHVLGQSEFHWSYAGEYENSLGLSTALEPSLVSTIVYLAELDCTRHD